ncbi:MAG TPA: LysM peptidoglycan-binding domain-containing protein [Anaerolineae bacterium]
MKQLFTLASILLVMMGAAACTREKPPVVEPTPTGAVAQEVTTPSSTTPGGGATIPTAAAITTTVPTAVATPVLPTTTAPTVTQPTAVPTSAPTTSATQAPVATGSATTYTVQWGDWLNKIAGRFGVSTQAILAANPGLNPNYIYPGQVINIPAAGQPGAPPTPGSSVPPPSNVPGTYTVQRGDWFYAIARKFSIGVVALQAANPTVNPNFVYPGQVLNIPSGSTPGGDPSTGTGSYTVKPGDTLFSIAVRLGKTVYALQIANHLPNPNFIYPGQMLVIP